MAICGEAGQSEHHAMIHKVTTLKFVVPEMLAVAFGIAILIGIYFTHKYPVPTARADANHSAVSGHGDAEPLNPGLSRVRLLVSGMR
jgi:hypothetical protein